MNLNTKFLPCLIYLNTINKKLFINLLLLLLLLNSFLGGAQFCDVVAKVGE